MRKAILGFLFFVNQTLQIFGNVIILIGPVNSTGHRKLICHSEDDNGALVWAYIPIWKSKFGDEYAENSKQFYNLNTYSNSKLDCKMQEYEKCLKSWSIERWNFTNSVETPMSPVFDQRWEEFEEFTINHLNFNRPVITLPSSKSGFQPTAKALVFSIQAVQGHIMLCYGNCLLCYLFEINKFNSIMKKCTVEWSIPATTHGVANSNLKCGNTVISNHGLKYPWQTFIIKWNGTTGEISLYDTDRAIIRYKEEKSEHLSLFSFFHVFIGVNETYRSALFRFHIYTFLHTKFIKSILRSPSIEFFGGTICVEMLLSLCADCDAVINLIDSSNGKIIETKTAEGLAKIHGLPTWQLVQIKTSFTGSISIVKIELVPTLKRFSNIDHSWGIANVRECPKKSSKSIIIYQKLKKTFLEDMHWLPITCYKFFYDKDISLLSDSKKRIEISNDCAKGKIGPECFYSCEHDLQSNAKCQNITICNENGCTCPVGYLGNSCSTPIEKPNKPTVTFVNDTYIHVILPKTWKYDYDRTRIFYSFEIREVNYENILPWDVISQNMTQLIGCFRNLTPSTAYKIRCILKFPGYEMHSDWVNVLTSSNLELIAYEIYESVSEYYFRAITKFAINYTTPNFNTCIKYILHTITIALINYVWKNVILKLLRFMFR